MGCGRSKAVHAEGASVEPATEDPTIQAAPEDPRKSEWAPLPPKSARDEMKIVTLQDLKQLGHIPERSESAVIPLSLMGRRPVFVVYISHQWMQADKGLPDTKDGIIFKTIVEGLESFKAKHLPEAVTVCVWISYCCRPKDGTSRSKVNCGLEASIPYYISRSDAFLTVIADPNDQSSEKYTQLPQAVEKQDLGHDAWCGHWSRAWQRLEALLATTVARPQSVSEHLTNMPDGWPPPRGSPRSRLHMVCAPGTGFLTMEPMSRELLATHLPTQGEVGNKDDMAVIDNILRVVQPQLQPGIYTGGTDSEGRRHGFGTCEFAAGGKYTGEWVAGKMHGKGEYHFPWSDVYVGQFEDGSRHGHGEYTYASGNRYVGHFVKNQRHGVGRYSYMSGAEYDGAFAFDQRHGYGKYTFPNGDLFEGDYIRGQIQGDGKLTKLDGSVYEGPWKDGKMHGHGTFTFTSGAKYIGEYALGEMHGQGTYTFPNGDVFRGDYEKGQMARGMFLFANGDVYEGEYKGGKMHGIGVFRSSQGDLYDGEFANDLKHGTGIMVLSNGTRYEGEFQDGKKHGIGRTCGADREWYEAEWKNGKRSKSKKLLDAIQASGSTAAAASAGGAASGSPRDTSEWSVSEQVGLSRITSERSKTPQKPKVRRKSPKKAARKAAPEPLLIQWSSSDMIGSDIVAEQVARCGGKQRRKAPIPYQKYPTALPPDRNFLRRAPAPPMPSGQPINPGAWVQHSSASSLLGVAGRYGIPQHLLQQLSIEADAEAARRKGRSLGTSLPGVLRPSSAPSHPSPLVGRARYSQSSDGTVTHSRPQSAVSRMQQAGSHQARKAGPGAEWDEALPWPPRQQVQLRQYEPGGPPGRGPAGQLLGHEPVAVPQQNNSDPEMANWLANSSGKQLPHIAPAEEAFTLGSPSASHGSLHDRIESGGWHPSIPKPVSWATPRPPGEDRAAGRPPSILRSGRPGSYGRAHHISLQSVAERA